MDGYNVIFSWPNLTDTAKESLEEARRELLDILCDYQGLKQNSVTVVFDAHRARGGLGSKQWYGNIRVVFTKESETADNYIERAAGAMARHGGVRVVTSDYTEQIVILGKGASRVSTREFFNEVEMVRTA